LGGIVRLAQRLKPFNTGPDMRKLIVTTLAALVLAGCGAKQSSSAQLGQLWTSFRGDYAAHDASKACSLFSVHGKVLVVQQVKEVGLIRAGEPATCENAVRQDFITAPTLPRLVSVKVNGNQATLNYGGIPGNAVKQNGTWRFNSDLV